jgi:large subunit ribosomal protein L5
MADKKKKEKAASPVPEGYKPYLHTLYHEKAAPAVREKFGLKNVMQVPRIEKVVLNMGVGEASRDIKILEMAEQDLTNIAGQKSRRTKAKNSIAGFKIREGMPVGCSVTLRRSRMWEFLHRLIFIALPRTRDFRGISPKAFDGRGNYSIGIREHIIFTEVDLSKTGNFGMNINIVTSADNDEQALFLLREMGFPIRS